MKISVPKNWKVVRQSFAKITWQQGQKNCICEKGKRSKYAGWKWTTRVQVCVLYNPESMAWIVTLIRPLHPIVSVSQSSYIDTSIDRAINVMRSMNDKYPEEEYGRIDS
jgi:hypothetical protein